MTTAQDAAVAYRWDLDKTYVQTDFHTPRGLWRAATEGAAEKRVVPGMKTLLQHLSGRPEASIIVVSGSPTQLRPRIEAMFELHGVRCDRLVLKDFVARVVRLRSLKAQVPYKLRAHLETRLWLNQRVEDAPEYCFGDDAEVDALVYCLYTDALARRIDATALRSFLDHCGAYPDEISAILRALAELPRQDPVKRVFIHLDGRSPPSRFDAYRGRVTPTFNGLQVALCLLEEGVIDGAVTAAVAAALVTDFRVDALGLLGSIEDALRRRLVCLATATELTLTFESNDAIRRGGWSPEFSARARARLGGAYIEPSLSDASTPLKYHALLDDERSFARARRLARAAAKKVPGLSDFLAGEDA